MISQRAVPFSRFFLARAFFAVILSLVLVAPTVSSVEAAAMQNLRKYAGIVVDAKSGKVLYEEAADSKRYPASVSKVMTLYILFQELTAGNMKLSTKMTVSRHAAAAVPTKLGLKAGSTITVENAIKALTTLSANDIARVIAEHISGSESKFAERMTATADGLGMKRTTYRNASGLPDAGQVTTVRDQAILGIAVYQHFPAYYEYFQTRSFSYGKRTYGNHNRLLGENGIDGIKTGYINASGSNLLTAARKDNRHIIVVGFGFNSSGARDAKVRALVSKYLPKGRKGGYLQTAMIPQPGRFSNSAPVQVATAEESVFVVPMPLPSFRLKDTMQGNIQVAAYAPQPGPAPAPSNIAQEVTAALDAPSAVELQPAVRAANVLGAPSAMPQPAVRSDDVIGQWISDTLGAPPAALGQTAPSAPLVPPVGVGAEGQPIDLMTSGATGGKPAQLAEVQPMVPLLDSAKATDGWIVQIGAAPTQDGANQLLASASGRLNSLDNFRSYIERFEKNGQVFYRARFSGFGDRSDATGMCNQLKKENLTCLALQS